MIRICLFYTHEAAPGVGSPRPFSFRDYSLDLACIVWLGVHVVQGRINRFIFALPKDIKLSACLHEAG